MIHISREAAQVLRDYVGSTLPYGNVHVQAAVNELIAALDAPAGCANCVCGKECVKGA
jgi:hypothetical protein